jgi:hypothetical protein
LVDVREHTDGSARELRREEIAERSLVDRSITTVLHHLEGDRTQKADRVSGADGGCKHASLATAQLVPPFDEDADDVIVELDAVVGETHPRAVHDGDDRREQR